MAKNLNIKNKKKNFLGTAALISGGINLTSSLISNIIKKKQAEKQQDLADQENTKSIISNVNNSNDEYSTYLANHPELVYGTKKEIQALGNGLDTITKDMQLVNSGTHESGNDLERSKDYVEGGEVVMGNAVHSNRIDAYSPAQMSASMGVLLDEVSRISKHSKGAVRGELDRLSAKINKRIDNVTKVQEAIKDEYGFTVDGDGKINQSFSSSTGNQNIDKPKHTLGIKGVWDQKKEAEELAKGIGGTGIVDQISTNKFKDFMTSNSDYINLGVDLSANVLDNIVNASLLKKTPKIPKPVNYINTPLKTDIDVTDQLSMITDQQAKLDAIIDSSTGSSNTAIQRKRASADASVKSKNEVLAQKERIETGLTNEEILKKQEIENRNKDLLRLYDQDVYQRETEILGAKSKNIENLSRDFSDVLDKFRYGKFQSEQLMTDLQKYGDTGIFATNALNGNYDQASKSDKLKVLDMIKSVGRLADYNALKSRWKL